MPQTKMFADDLVRAAFHEADYAISITDLQGRIVTVNNAYLQLYGFESADELRGRTHAVIRSPHNDDAVYRNIWKELNEGRVWRGDLVNHSRSGDDVYVHQSITPVFLEKEKKGYMGFSLDRSHQVQMERQLLHANRLVVLGTIGAGLAHELNNPMTSISLEAEYLKELFENDGDQLDVPMALRSTENILVGVERMQKVVEHLMAYVRKESVGQKEELDLAELVDDSLLFLEKQFQGRGIVVDVDVEAGLCVLGIKNDLESVFHNLLTNSRDAFSPEQPLRWIRLEGRQREAGWAEITVADNAGGVSEELQKKIFDPFFTTKDEGKGTGLGLSISRKIVNEHGGSIQCSSAGGECYFKLILPLVRG